MKTLCKFHRIPGTQSRVTTKVHDLLGQPSYILLEGEHVVKGLIRQRDEMDEMQCDFVSGRGTQYAFLAHLSR